MPTSSTCKHWTDQSTKTYTRPQHQKLERELASDDDSAATNMFEGSDHNPLADLNNPATYEAAIVSIHQDLEELSFNLEIEMLDLELSNNLDVDMEDPPSPTSPSSVSSHTLSCVEDNTESISQQQSSTLLQYMKGS